MSHPAKVVLITGAARRIGSAIVREMHSTGWNILVHYHYSGDEAKAVACQLNAKRPDSVRLLAADLADIGRLPLLIEGSLAAWGRLDALINNASAFYPTPVGTVTEAQWEALLGSNLKAPFFLAQAASESLRRQQGAIVNLVDVYAERPLKNHPVYSIAKAGLAALTRSLAVELAPEIRVNGVSPGAILWPAEGQDVAVQQDLLMRVPLGRTGAPGDIARAVRFFLEDAPYVTGQILAVDGGRSLFI
jgi:pteridine reductase